MAQVVKEVRQSVVDDDAVRVAPTRVVDEHGISVAERIVYFIGGFIMAILALRFLLSLMGANRGNAFASLIYSISYPFVAPFFGLFNYQTNYGVSRFEYETLIAILVWGLITLAVAKLVTLGSRRED
jgi:uncharacterized protein YggT (Ycf19 family)